MCGNRTSTKNIVYSHEAYRFVRGKLHSFEYDYQQYNLMLNVILILATQNVLQKDMRLFVKSFKINTVKVFSRMHIVKD